MCKIFKMKRAKARTEVVELLKKLLVRAESGEIEGISYTLATRSGDAMGICGAYADRMQYAIYSTTQQLHTLVEMACRSAGVGTSHSPTVERGITTIDTSKIQPLEDRHK